MKGQENAQFLSTYFKSNTILQDNTEYELNSTKEILTAEANKLHGFRLDGMKITFADVFVKTLSLYVNEDGVVDVFIYNAKTGQKIKEILGIQVFEYFNEIELNILLNSKNQNEIDFLILLDLKELQVLKTVYSNDNTYSQYLMARAGVIDSSTQKLSSNFEQTQEGYGLTIDYSYLCSYANLICSISEQLKYAYLYLLGYECMNEAIMNDRFNISTMNIETRIMYRDMYLTEYKNSLNNALVGIQIPDSLCTICNTITKSVYFRP
jgi:hypothetical protein